MHSDAVQGLISSAQRGGYAYVRNLAAAEAAVLAGQFNVAKILRAVAHSRRVMALEAARLLVGRPEAQALLEANLKELDTETDKTDLSPDAAPDANDLLATLARSRAVSDQLEDILSRAIASLKENEDVLERDVAQLIWGCYGCGYLAETDLPESCPSMWCIEH